MWVFVTEYTTSMEEEGVWADRVLVYILDEQLVHGEIVSVDEVLDMLFHSGTLGVVHLPL